MPELPEVETIRRIVEPQIAGLNVESVIINHSQIVAYPDMYRFERELMHQVIRRMSRRGKFLTIHFDSGDRLVVHLRMTGQLLITTNDYPLEKHTHLIADLSNGKQIRYTDVRRFGRFWYLRKDEDDTVTGQDKLGLEPLDEKLTASFLRSKLERRKKSIKEMLQDQSIVAGIGNIYSDEMLYDAGIYPEESCCRLDDDDWTHLAKSIKKIISWGIDTNQMTAEEYLAGKGKEYHNMPYLKMYGREGQSCEYCGSVIQRIVIGGRSSCYCPQCQKKKAE